MFCADVFFGPLSILEMASKPNFFNSKYFFLKFIFEIMITWEGAVTNISA